MDSDRAIKVIYLPCLTLMEFFLLSPQKEVSSNENELQIIFFFLNASSHVQDFELPSTSHLLMIR